MQKYATNKRTDEEPEQNASSVVKRTIPFEVEMYTVPQSSPKEGRFPVRRPLSPDGFNESIVIKHKRFGERYHACQSISPILPWHDLSYVPLSYLSESGVQNESMEKVGGAMKKAITLEDQVPVGTLPTNSFQRTSSIEPSGPEVKHSSSQVAKPLVYRDGLPFDIYHDSDDERAQTEPSGPGTKEPLLHEVQRLDPAAEVTELKLILDNLQLELSSENSERSLQILPAKVTVK